MKPTVTRTQNPLPFGDMEPKRFEDMARQLAYDFRPWRQLEATGRSGDDEGFDARGFEIVPPLPAALSDEALGEEPPVDISNDRLWLIQCKRERAIGPALMKKHVEGIPAVNRQDLHGVLFVAACDFSLTTRNVLRDWCRTYGIAECIIWGKAELEDLLFQPKNDGLLFAYFGISLRIARQRMATDLRREIALKRKLKRLFPDQGDLGAPLVLRDPSDSRYPFVDGDSLTADKCLWLPRKTLGIGPFGPRIVIREFWAFHDWETERWDIASAIDFSLPDEGENPWHEVQAEPGRRETVRKIVDFWTQFPRRSQCFVTVYGHIKYSDIIEIDDVGDQFLSIPTIYVSFKDGIPPYDSRTRLVVGNRHEKVELDPTKHATVFPDDMRNLTWENAFFAAESIKRSTEPYPVDLTEPEWKKGMPQQQP